MARTPTAHGLRRVVIGVFNLLLPAGFAAGRDAPPPHAQVPPQQFPSAAGESTASAGDEAERARPPAAGGGSKASGGDPTTTGRAQEIGNRHVGELLLKSVYD